MLQSSTNTSRITALAGLAVLTWLIVPVLGLVLFLVGKGVGQLIGQLDPNCSTALNPSCLTATARLFYGVAEAGLVIMFSPVISWLGMLLLTSAAALLMRFRLSCFFTLVPTGALIGICVARMMLNTWDIAELGGMGTFALMGAGYAFVFWLLVKYATVRNA